MARQVYTRLHALTVKTALASFDMVQYVQIQCTTCVHKKTGVPVNNWKSRCNVFSTISVFIIYLLLNFKSFYTVSDLFHLTSLLAPQTLLMSANSAITNSLMQIVDNHVPTGSYGRNKNNDGSFQSRFPGSGMCRKVPSRLNLSKKKNRKKKKC